MRQIGNRYPELAELAEKLRYLLVRKLKKSVEQPQFIHHLHGRGVNGIAAEITQEVGVFLEHRDRTPGTGQQQSEHQAGGTSANNAAVERVIGQHREHHARSCFLLRRMSEHRAPSPLS
jgi:hypothetical protein